MLIGSSLVSACFVVITPTWVLSVFFESIEIRITDLSLEPVYIQILLFELHLQLSYSIFQHFDA